MKRSARQEKLLSAKRSYNEKPFLRRARTCESILGGSALVMFAVLFAVSRLASLARDDASERWLVVGAVLGFLGFLGAVLFVCLIALTGPVYKQQLDFESGDLETWGLDKGAALILSALITVAAVFVAKHYA